MKIVKNVLSISTIIFALLGLLRILPYDITSPIMLFSLSTSLIVQSIEMKKK